MNEALDIIIGGTADPSGRRGRNFVAAANSGELIALAPGRFVDAARWASASARSRHLARIVATQDRVADRLVLSHTSAAAVYDLPWSGEWPSKVTFVDPDRSNAQVLPNVRKYPPAGRSMTVSDRRGMRLSGLVATVVDILLTEPLARSLPIIDVALQRGWKREAFLHELERRNVRKGVGRARLGITLGDGASGSLGESECRLVLYEIGAPAPVLQQEFRDRHGFVARVDYWFADYGVVLEFDGAVKYLDRAMRSGRSASQVVIDEKRREDRLRQVRGVRTVIRCGLSDVRAVEPLRQLLLGAGIPLQRRSRRTLH